MRDMSVPDALGVLRAAGEVGLRDAEGRELAVTVLEVGGGRMTVLAPRLQVARGMELFARIIPSGSEPWLLALEVARADYEDDEHARADLRVTGLVLDPQRRAYPRLPVGGKAWLEAVACRDVVDGDRVDGTMVDVSEQGFAFDTLRVLHRGDRLLFHARFFAEVVEADVRIVGSRPSGVAGRTIYGCQIIEIHREQRERLTRILSGTSPAAARSGLDTEALRSLILEQIEPQRSRWRLRRSA
jgi:hypothetical protein